MFSIHKTKLVTAYINGHRGEIKSRLKSLRAAIQKAAPNSEEGVSYGIPAYSQNGVLVWFAAHKNNIGLYPRVSALTFFKKDLKRFKTSRGSIQFQNDEPLPLALVSRIVKFRVKQNLKRKK